MNDLLALSSGTTWLGIGVVVAIGVQMIWMTKALKNTNSDLETDNHQQPSDADAAAEGNGYRTQVAAPRARKLQASARSQSLSAAETAQAEASSKTPADEVVPIAPLKTVEPGAKESELAEPVLASAEMAPAAKEDPKPADVPSKDEPLIPAGALVLGANAPATAPEAKTGEPTTEEVPVPKLPPLTVEGPASRPNEIPAAGRKFFGPSNPAAPVGALTASANPPGGSGDKEETVALPPLSSVLPSLPGELKKEEVAAAKVEPASDAPKIEQAGDGLIAVGAPVEITGKDEPAAVTEDPDDVKKKSPRTPALEPTAASGGLILMPTADAKAEPAAEKAAEPVLSPTAADTTPAAKPEETKPTKGPRVFLPGKFFGRSKEKETVKIPEPAPAPEPVAAKEPVVADKVEEPATPKITEPAAAPALVTPPVEETAAKPEEKAAVEPLAVKEEPKPAEAPEAPKPVEAEKAKEEAPAAKGEDEKAPAPEAKRDEAPAPTPEPEKPEAKIEPTPEPEKPAPVESIAPKGEAPREEKAAEPVPVPTLPREESAPGRSSLVATSQTAPSTESKAKEDVTLPTRAAPTTEPIAEPIVPILVPAAAKPAAAEAPASAETAVPVPTISTGTPAAPSQPEPAAIVSSLSNTQPNMPSTEATASPITTTMPNAGRASAQLTIAFEVTSLQLTPFFKLGSVQLKALSNVVSLHLLAAQADNPLAAGISFQIDRVELDGSEHLKSILLRPLGESRTLTAPQSKLQVDSVAVTGGGSESAPIAVTTSSQASTAVQLFGNFTIAAMDFTPAFEIGSLRLEPTSNTVLLRVAPSNRPTALDLPPSFEVAAVQLVDGAQIGGMRLTPGGKAS